MKLPTVLLVACLLLGCTDPEPSVARTPLEPSAHDQEPTAKTPEPTAQSQKPKAKGQRPKANGQRPKANDQKPIAREVDWTLARALPRVKAAVPAAELAKLDAIRVPVLLPDDRQLLQTLLVTHHGDWYAAAMEHDRADIYIRGTRNEFVVPGLEHVEVPEYWVTRTHAIVTVSWRAFGVAYNLDVECFAALEDPRCTEDEYALGLAESLAFAGGQP